MTVRRGVEETTVTFRMPTSLKEEIQTFARERGETMTAFVIRAFRDATRPDVAVDVVERTLAERMSAREASLHERQHESA